MEAQAVIWTEGKTDWQHLKRAFQALRVGPRFSFKEDAGDLGDDQLLKQCVALARFMQPCPTIFIFDHDNDQIVTKVDDSLRGYKAWGNNVYSFAIPIPPHRMQDAGACIELYYTDDELRTPDGSGRRLFLSNEFNAASGRVHANPNLNIGNKGKLPSGKGASNRIIDSEVYDEQHRNVALSKADFARYVTESSGQFAGFQFEAFRAILTVIDRIIEEALVGNNLAFGDLAAFLKGIDGLDIPHQLALLIDGSIRACKLSAMIFVSATLRHYESRIVDAAAGDIRKVRPIKQVLADSFGAPSLAVLQKLARHCYHLIDEQAPGVLATMRSMMAEAPTLGPLGDMLEQLERVLPGGPTQARTLNQRDLKRPVLEYVISQLAKYEGRVTEITETVSAAGTLRSDADPGTWCAALAMLVRIFSPLRHIVFRIRSIERVRGDGNDFLVALTTYQDQLVVEDQVTQRYQDLTDDRLESYELLVGEGGTDTSLDLFPFVIIKGGRLQYYNRTKSQGYEYLPAFGSTGHLWPTKRKFSHLALRSTSASDLQGLFWAQATPSVSSVGVKANIPAQEPIVGRKEQISTVMTDIIQIPNQNGIIHGHGGVGKTALLIELSRQLFESPSDTRYFKNIIWVSAKRDSYDPTLGVTEPRMPQFQSMDNVLDSILDFHGFEDSGGYDRNDKKGLVVECFRDERTLLILDNFETVRHTEQEEIIQFFGLEVKRALRDKPDFFKVIVTSREQIPSGFHQIELKGLDRRESKELMQRLYEPYRRSGRQQLTAEQLVAVYEATRGIPLIMKHCYGQIFEFNRPVDAVLKGLSGAGNKVVEFSFSEILQLLKQDELKLKTILVLELSGRPMMSRQIADILGLPEPVIADRLIPLRNFQCVTHSSSGLDEKYCITEDVRFFARRLTLEYANLATDIKRQIAELPLEKRMDYSREDADAIMLFQDYLAQGHHVLAEEFVRERLRAHPESALLNLYYARYLKEIKQRTDEAIERLESIRERSGNDPVVLSLLMAYYIALKFPNFEQAHSYALELEALATGNAQIRFEVAKFYVAWSTSIKMKYELDPLKEMLRQQKYKDLADRAIKLLLDIGDRSCEWYYLMAQSCYNSWDYERALRHIEMAIDGLPIGSRLAGSYLRFKNEIMTKRAQFARDT